MATPPSPQSLSDENGDENDPAGQHGPDTTPITPPSASFVRTIQLEEARKRVPPKGLAKINTSRTEAFGTNAGILIRNNRRLGPDVNAFPSSHKLRSAIRDDIHKQAASAHREDTQHTITLSQNSNQLNVNIAFYVH